MGEPCCGYVNGFIKQMYILMLCLMVIYCTPCILHGPFTAVPSMAVLSQRMPAIIMTAHDNCGAQGNKTRNTPQFTKQQHLNGKRLHQKLCRQVYGFSLYIQVGFEWNTNGNVKYVIRASH